MLSSLCLRNVVKDSESPFSLIASAANLASSLNLRVVSPCVLGINPFFDLPDSQVRGLQTFLLRIEKRLKRILSPFECIGIGVFLAPFQILIALFAERWTCQIWFVVDFMLGKQCMELDFCLIFILA